MLLDLISLPAKGHDNWTGVLQSCKKAMLTGKYAN